MSRIKKKLKLSDEKFKRRIGTTKPVFQTMLDLLQTAYDRLHEQGGKPPALGFRRKTKCLILSILFFRCSFEIATLPPRVSRRKGN